MPGLVADFDMQKDDGIREWTYVGEAEELNQLIARIVDSNGSQAPVAYTRFSGIMQKYREQSQLLDPHLASIVAPLAELVGACATSGEAGLPTVAAVSRLLWVVATVRGHKTVVKFFPNDAGSLEPVIGLLQRVKAHPELAASGEDDGSNSGTGSWPAECTLMLWLSMLVLIPFDLSTVDSSLASGPGADAGQGYPPMVGTLSSICQDALAQPGSARDMAALLAGRLLTRPDCSLALRDFVKWAEGALQEEGPQAVFLLPGAIHALASIFKLGARRALLPVAESLWPCAAGLLSSPAVAHSVLARKLAIKLAGRIGMTFLAPRVAAWRYQQGSSHKGIALAQGDQNGSNNQQAADAGGEAADEEEDFEVAEEVEEVIGVLLDGLADKDTVVRWSAAKALGRITGRLPKDFADEVVTSMLDLFTPTQSDTAWHGGCLALAELARRGLLLPHRLQTVTPLVARALEYDVRRGPHSVGAHVRDAAAYVCWAFARAYSAQTIADSVLLLAPALLTTACFDREVNCRRAASAAFQESVGRLGNFPHGIDILTAADYFTLSTRSQAYMEVAPFIASFPEYRTPLAHHLLEIKLRHWERSLRELAARALGALAHTDAEFFASAALDKLLPLCSDSVLEVRHGAGLGLAEILLALHKMGVHPTASRQAAIAAVVPAVEKARLYRGKGGELMRSSICRLVECIAEVQLPLTAEQRRKLHDSLDENLRHPSTEIQSGAAAAMKAYARAYLAEGSSQAIARSTEKYLAGLSDPNVAVRRGSAAALGALPHWLLLPCSDALFQGLATALQVEEDVEDRDVESRVAAAQALASTACKCYGNVEPNSSEAGPAARDLADIILPALMGAMDDYSTDNRGDVGSWVREAAMEGLVRILPLMHVLLPPQHHRAKLDPVTAQVIAALVQQSVERIGRTREVALLCLGKVLLSELPLNELPGIAALRHAVLADVGDAAGSSDDLEVISRMAKLITVPTLRPAVLEGLVASIGGLDASLTRVASAALVQALGHSEKEEAMSLLAAVAEALLELWENRPLRLAVPLLRTAILLMTQAGLDQLQPDILERLLEAVRGEARQCSDIPRLAAVAELLCQLAGCGAPVGQATLQSIMVLLTSRYPKVRKFTAEQLYLRLLAMEDDLPGADAEAGTAAPDLDAALDILMMTPWDGPLLEVRTARMQLAAALQLPASQAAPIKASVGSTAGGGGSLVGTGARKTDGNETYQSFIDSVSRETDR